MKSSPTDNDNLFCHKAVYAAIEKLRPERSPKYGHCDIQAISSLFSEIFKNLCRFNETSRCWYIYNGIVWTKDIGGSQISNIAKEFILLLRQYAFSIQDSENFDSHPFKSFVSKLGDLSKRDAIIRDSRSNYCISDSDLDSDGYLFNCKNCVIDLRTLTQLEHSPDLLLSKCSNVVYDPKAYSAEFDRFLDEIMQGNINKKNYLKTLFGYSLLGVNFLEQCYFFWGPTTRNGKSTLMDVITFMHGEYAKNVQPDTFAVKNKNSSAPSGDLARLKGVRLAHITEPKQGMALDISLIKQFTGRDAVTTRFLYEREFEYTPVCKIIMNTNHLPKVNDETLFTSKRARVVTFNRHFSEAEQDPDLKDRLKSQENISAVFNWCVSGLREFQRNGNKLIDPPEIQKASDTYRKMNDKIGMFIADAFEMHPERNTKVGDAYFEYMGWCHTNGYQVDNKHTFIQQLRNRGILSDTGTVDGITCHNVLKGYYLPKMYIGVTKDDAPF